MDAVGYPFKGAKCWMNREILVIHNAIPIEDVKIENSDVGKVIFIQQDRLVVVCGQGLLKIDEAVFENSNESIFPLKKLRNRFK